MLPRGRKSPVATRASSVVPIIVPEVQQESARSPTTPPPLPFPKHPAPVNEPARPPHLTIVRTPVTPTPTPTPLPLPRKVDEPKDPRSMIGAVILVILTVVVTTVILAWQRGFISMARQKVQFALSEHERKLIEDGEQDRAAKVAAEQKAEAERTAKVAAEAEAKKNGEAYAVEFQKRAELEQKIATLEKANTELEARYKAADQQLIATVTKLNEVNDLLNKNKAQKRIRAMVQQNVQLETRKRELEDQLAKVTGDKTRLQSAVEKAREQLKLIKMQQEEVGGRIAWLETEARKVPGLIRQLTSIQKEFELHKAQAAKMSKYPAPGSKEEFITWIRMQLALNESSWDWEAIGDPIVNKKGEVIINPKTGKPYRAYGFTQQHEKYLPERTLKYCGSVRTPQQFLKDKTCQIAVELGMLEDYYDDCPADWTRKAYCIAGKWIGGGANLRTSDGNVTKAEYMFMVHKSPDSKVKGTWDALVAKITKAFGSGSLPEPPKPAPAKKKAGKATRVAKK